MIELSWFSTTPPAGATDTGNADAAMPTEAEAQTLGIGPGARCAELWAGTDAGKAEHHCTVIDANGSLARSESASGRPATVVDIPAGPVALSVADGVREATTNIGPFARYRAWLPLPDHGCAVLFDMTTPHVSGWETYGLLMAGILRTTRIGEQAE